MRLICEWCGKEFWWITSHDAKFYNLQIPNECKPCAFNIMTVRYEERKKTIDVMIEFIRSEDVIGLILKYL
jgi:hypothetical protein